MKVLIIGAGRMGIRHLQGVLSVKAVTNVTILDINPRALQNAKDAVNNDERLLAELISDYKPVAHDVCIIASTANNRKTLIDLAVESSCKYLMVEKPLGQSFQEVLDLNSYIETLPLTAVVNLNMRQYQSVKKLKSDLANVAQLQGDKVITVNTGSLGIGCNGIHYLDKIFFILGANKAEIVSAEIEDTLIPSGRGENFGDFGGWAVIKYYDNDRYLARCLISMTAGSTAFGGWEIIAPCGRIVIDEIAATRKTILRKPNSVMPLNRYGADYMEPIMEKYESPFLGDLTAEWISSLMRGSNELPLLKDSLKSHKLMFDWLSYSKKYSKIYPIT